MKSLFLLLIVSDKLFFFFSKNYSLRFERNIKNRNLLNLKLQSTKKKKFFSKILVLLVLVSSLVLWVLFCPASVVFDSSHLQSWVEINYTCIVEPKAATEIQSRLLFFLCFKLLKSEDFFFSWKFSAKRSTCNFFQKKQLKYIWDFEEKKCWVLE